eukprot:11039516-Alexandrium_andersonii.AAC.1
MHHCSSDGRRAMLATAGRHRMGGGRSRAASASVRPSPSSLIGAIGALWQDGLGVARPPPH